VCIPVPVDEAAPVVPEPQHDGEQEPKGNRNECQVCHGTGLWSGIEGSLYRCLACVYEMT